MTDAASLVPVAVKKHTGAIHIKNDISCLQRKAWNVLLHNAYEELGDPMVMVHRIKVRDLIELTGFNSKNIAYLKDALEDMVTTKLIWNIIDERGKKEWGVSAALASAVIVDGVCSYAYSPHLRAKLYNPEWYALIDLSIQRRFAKGHALTLYENCVRYRSISQTPVFSLDLFRDLMGVSDSASYSDFNALNRSVIKPAIKEINAVSDISITDVETVKEKRRVVGVKFIIQEQAQQNLAIEAVDSIDPDLYSRLREYFCLSEKQANEVLTQFPMDRVNAAMKYTEERYLERKIRKGKIAPYFIRILKDGDIPVGESAFDKALEGVASKKLNASSREQFLQQVAKEYRAQRLSVVKAYLDELDSNSREDLLAEFDAYLGTSNNRLVYGHWVKNGLEHKLVSSAFTLFVEQKILPEFEVGLKEFTLVAA